MFTFFDVFILFFFQKGGRKGRGAGFCVGGRGKMRQIEGVCVIFFYNDNKCEIVNDDFTWLSQGNLDQGSDQENMSY